MAAVLINDQSEATINIAFKFWESLVEHVVQVMETLTPKKASDGATAAGRLRYAARRMLEDGRQMPWSIFTPFTSIQLE